MLSSSSSNIFSGPLVFTEASTLPNIICSITAHIQFQVNHNHKWDPTDCQTDGAFVGDFIPDMRVHDYLLRLQKYLPCSPSCFVIMFVLLDRLLIVTSKSPVPVFLHTLSVHRLIMAAILLACKINEDISYNNVYFAKVGGMHLEDLNRAELEFIQLLGWDLVIPVWLFDRYYDQLLTSHSTICDGSCAF